MSEPEVDMVVEKIIQEAMKPTDKPMEKNTTVKTTLPDLPRGGNRKIAYTHNEDRLIEEFKAYIDKTYSEHYGGGKTQAIDNIIDDGDGVGFFKGCIIKYTRRYGKKDGYNRKDLMKILHYALLLLYVHDEENMNGKSNKS